MTHRAKQTISASIGLAAVFALTGCSGLAPGPLEAPPPHGYGGLIVDVGSTFSDGFETFFVWSKSPVVITKVELINTPDQLQLTSVKVAGEERESNMQFDADFPPNDYNLGPLVDAEGATFRPVEEQGTEMAGYALIMGITVTEPGKWVRGGYRLEYTSDGVAYGWDAVAEITICTPDFVDQNGECLMDDSE